MRKTRSKVKTWSTCQNFTSKRKLVIYNFANIAVKYVQRNGFVSNNSQMSNDRPKSANSNEGQFRLCNIIYTAHLKQQKMTKGAVGYTDIDAM